MTTKELANSQQKLRQLIEGPAVRQRINQTIAKGMDAEKLARLTLFAVNQQPLLLQCDPLTVVASMLQAARLGLEPDGGTLGHGYLVPYWSKKKNSYECQFIPGYRGLCKLARNSGEVADVSAEVVYEADQFGYTLGLMPTLQHVRNDDTDKPGRLKAVYAIARFRDGEKKFIVMNRRQVEEIKSRSSSRNKQGELVGPWVTDEAEMWKKTAVRRIAKLLPLSVETKAVFADDERAETVESTGRVVEDLPVIEDVSGEATDGHPDPVTLAEFTDLLQVAETCTDAESLCNEYSPRLPVADRDAARLATHKRQEEIRTTRGARSNG